MTAGRKILLIALLLLPVLLVAVFSILQTKNQLAAHIYEERNTKASLAANILKAKLDHLYEIGLSLSSRPVFRINISEKKWGAAIGLMTQVPADFAYITNIIIADSNGAVLAETPSSATSSNFFQHKFIPNRQTDEPFLSDVYKLSQQPNTTYVLLSCPLASKGQQAASFLILQVDINALIKWSMQVSIGKSGYVYIVDKTGHVAFSPGLPDTDSLIDYSSVPAVQKALRGEKNAAVLYNPIAKENRLAAFEQVPDYGWAVIVQQEAGTALSIGKGLRSIFIFYSLVLLMACVFAWFVIKEINRRRKTEEQVTALSRQIDQSNDAIFTVDKKRLITSWNLGAEKIYGFSLNEAIGKEVNELLRTALEKNEVEEVAEHLLCNNYWSGELIRKRKDGTDINILSSTSTIRDAAGNITGFVGVNLDVTEQVQLKKQVNYLAALVDQTSDAIVSVSLTDRFILSWNRGAERLYGYSSSEVIGKNVRELGIANLRKADLLLAFKQVKEKGFWHSEMLFYHKNGGSFTGTVNVNLVKNPAGQITGLVFIVRDITSRKKLEETLRQYNTELENKVSERTAAVYRNELRFRAMVENNNDMVSMLDASMTVTYRSPSIFTILQAGQLMNLNQTVHRKSIPMI